MYYHPIKENQGFQPYQMQEKWNNIQTNGKITAEGHSFTLDAMDKVFLRTDVDEFYNQLVKILSNDQSKYQGQWIISNPCFEIWLYYCYKNDSDKDLASLVPLTTDKRSLKLKSLGNMVIAGGLNPRYAFEHSKEHFTQDGNDISMLLATEMHKMAGYLIDAMNSNANEYPEFVKKKEEWREMMRKMNLL